MDWMDWIVDKNTLVAVLKKLLKIKKKYVSSTFCTLQLKKKSPEVPIKVD